MFSIGGQTGVEIFAKPVTNRNAMKVQTLLLAKPVKKFATDKNERIFLKVIFIKSASMHVSNLQNLEFCLVSQSQRPIHLSGTVLPAYLPEAIKK